MRQVWCKSCCSHKFNKLKINKTETTKKFFKDVYDETYYFYSDASQETINALDFNGEWYIVKEILINWGYKIIEISLN